MRGRGRIRLLRPNALGEEGERNEDHEASAKSDTFADGLGLAYPRQASSVQCPHYMHVAAHASTTILHVVQEILAGLANEGADHGSGLVALVLAGVS
jgi:hypothetical protein